MFQESQLSLTDRVSDEAVDFFGGGGVNYWTKHFKLLLLYAHSLWWMHELHNRA